MALYPAKAALRLKSYCGSSLTCSRSLQVDDAWFIKNLGLFRSWVTGWVVTDLCVFTLHFWFRGPMISHVLAQFFGKAF
jgi:hypothetical protein